jgi:DNA (cytosine-5)-methyltransferase 1
MQFVDLFAGTGAFHYALASLGHECVFASEKDDELRELYIENFAEMAGKMHGDIRDAIDAVPPHDILCAGFPCQPFSKSGSQIGTKDPSRGTLFHEIVRIARRHEPAYIVLENVGNFERHDGGRTWDVVRTELEQLGYSVRGTEHIGSGGHGLVSPHHFGHPHHRERFFIVAAQETLPDDPFPRGDRNSATSLTAIVSPSHELDDQDKRETQLTTQQVACIDHWNSFLQALPEEHYIPSFPIWGDEINATYPYENITPFYSLLQLDFCPAEIEEILSGLPRYARVRTLFFPDWKVQFIKNNREWLDAACKWLPAEWCEKLRTFPPSLRKLEWNCKGEERNLWNYVLQFRPSGLRAKRYSASPALVSMTTTQIPILGPQRRFLTRTEGLRLQGLPEVHRLPRSRANAFSALGNGVHVDVVKRIGDRLFSLPQAEGTAVTTERVAA